MSTLLRTRLGAFAFAAVLVGCTTGADLDATPEGGTSEEGGTPPPGPDGGPAPAGCGRLTMPCATGEKCEGAPDCASKICRDMKCQEAAPADGTKNNDETDVDCGGTKAPACADGKGCAGPQDCTSGVCTANVCKAPTATDGVKNGTETGLDCGGASAPKCAAGRGCSSNTDCNNLKCDPTSKMCLAASHTDGLKNDGETGTDCGGTAPTKCPVGQGCVATLDCDNVKCDVGATNLCLPASHTDGIKNDGETGTDCGGTAPTKCPTGQGCASNTDCDLAKCDVGATNVCLAPSHSDGVKNLGETGIDCGGAALPAKCPAGQGCASNADCNNLKCDVGATNLCLAASSSDGIKNGTETDIDCGGGAPTNAPKCAVGLACNAADANCLSGACNYASKCVESRSCRGQHGGDTCGPTGTSSCCESKAAGGAQLDVYNITAGRFRKFVEWLVANNAGNMRTYIMNNKPAWWTDAWSAFLPTVLDNGLITPDDAPAYSGIYQELGPYVHGVSAGGNRGCNVGGPGARTFRLPDAVNTRMADPQAYTQDFLDERSLNCVTVYIVAAFCAWDGGKLPTFAQLDAAWGNGTYPWGNAGAPLGYHFAQTTNPNGGVQGAYGEYQSAPFPAAPLSQTDLHWANYNMNYWGGASLIGTDYSIFLAPPGRFPNGNGPLGHADLAGNVFNSLDINTTNSHWSRSGSWQGHPIPWSAKGSETNFPANYKYWAMGGRCAR